MARRDVKNQLIFHKHLVKQARKQPLDRYGLSKLERGYAELLYADREDQLHRKVVALPPEAVIHNHHLYRGRWPFKKSLWLPGPLMARPAAAYLPRALQKEQIEWTLDHPEREYIPRPWNEASYSRYVGQKWVGSVPRRVLPRPIVRTRGPVVGAIPPVRPSLAQAHWMRQPKEVRQAKRLQLAALDRQMNWDGLAMAVAERGQAERRDFKGSDGPGAQPPDECLGEFRWHRGHMARTYAFEASTFVETPEGPKERKYIDYTLPAHINGLSWAQRELIYSAYARNFLMQRAELERPNVTDNPQFRQALEGLAKRIGYTHTIESYGGTLLLGETVVAGPFGRTIGFATDTGGRDHVTVYGASGSAKSLRLLSMVAGGNVPAVVIEEPKTQDLVRYADYLHRFGHRVAMVDLMPESAVRGNLWPTAAGEGVSLGPPKGILDYVPTSTPIPQVKFDPVGDPQRLISPGGYNYAKRIAEEIFDGLDRTLEKPRHLTEVNTHLYRGPISEALGSCLVRSALDTLGAPEGQPAPSFWHTFEDYWSVLAGNITGQSMVTRIHDLEEAGRIQLGEEEPRSWANVNYRSAVLSALLREGRRDNLDGQLGSTADQRVLDDMVRNAENFVPRLQNSVKTQGDSIIGFVFGNGASSIHEAADRFARPGEGMTYADMEAANAVFCLAIGGERGPVNFSPVFAREALDRQALEARDVKNAAETWLGQDRSTASIVQGLGIPSRATDVEFDDFRQALEAGVPLHPDTDFWYVHNEAGSQAHTFSVSKMVNDFEQGAKHKTNILAYNTVNEPEQHGISRQVAAQHMRVMIGVRNRKAQWLMGTAENPIKATEYYSAYLPDKVSERFDPEAWIKNPAASDPVIEPQAGEWHAILLRMVNPPALAKQDRTTSHSPDKAVTLDEYGRPIYSPTERRTVNVKTWAKGTFWDDPRHWNRASQQQALPYSQIREMAEGIEELQAARDTHQARMEGWRMQISTRDVGKVGEHSSSAPSGPHAAELPEPGVQTINAVGAGGAFLGLPDEPDLVPVKAGLRTPMAGSTEQPDEPRPVKEEQDHAQVPAPQQQPLIRRAPAPSELREEYENIQRRSRTSAGRRQDPEEVERLGQHRQQVEQARRDAELARRQRGAEAPGQSRTQEHTSAHAKPGTEALLPPAPFMPAKQDVEDPGMPGPGGM